MTPPSADRTDEVAAAEAGRLPSHRTSGSTSYGSIDLPLSARSRAAQSASASPSESAARSAIAASASRYRPHDVDAESGRLLPRPKRSRDGTASPPPAFSRVPPSAGGGASSSSSAAARRAANKSSTSVRSSEDGPGSLSRRSSMSGRSVRAPVLHASANGAGNQGTSPLAKVGVKGDNLMMFITCFISIGVLLFGYDQGVMSAIITGPNFRHFFHQPSAYEIGLMVAVLEVGAFFTSLACGTLADVFGRKRTLFWGACIFSAGGAIQTFTNGFAMMVVGRVIAGCGVGILSMIVPTYQSEISPAEDRGRLACIEFTGNIVGYAFSIWFDYGASFLPGDISWRLPLSMQVVFGLILAAGSLLLPESPRWLLDRDRDDEGMRVLADLHGAGDPMNPRARLEFREIKENVLFLRTQGDRGYRTMFRKYLSRVLMAISGQIFAQLNGINVVSYYAPLVFESAGWVGRDAILMTGINAIIYVASTIPPWYLVDSWGRRPILISGGVVMAVALFLTGYFLYVDTGYTARAVVGCIITYNAFFGFSWGPIPWLLPSEIMPLSFRAKGASLATAANWASNTLVGLATPVLQEAISWRLYPMHGFFCVCSVVVVFFFYVETAGVPLEEMGTIFGEEEGPVPQGDDEDSEAEEEAEAAAEEEHRRRQSSEDRYSERERTPRAIRRSISSHPRFLSEDERAARRAAAKVAADERARAKRFFGLDPRGWFGRLTGSNASGPDRRLYETLGREER